MEAINTVELVVGTIKSNHPTYKFGKGKYDMFEVVIETTTGYINAAELCRRNKKYFKHCIKNKDIKDDFDDLAQEFLLDGASSNTFKEVSFYIGDVAPALRGTYVHPYLVPSIAEWVDKSFRRKARKMIHAWIIETHRKEIATKDRELKLLEGKNLTLLERLDAFEASSNAKMNEAFKQTEIVINKLDDAVTQRDVITNELSKAVLEREVITDELLETKDILTDTLDEVEYMGKTMDIVFEKLDIACDDRVLKTSEDNIGHFVFIRLFEPITRANGVEYYYRIIRCKKSSLKSRLNNKLNKGTLLHHIVGVPNSGALFDFIKMYSWSPRNPSGRFDFNNTLLDLYMEEEEFIALVDDIYEKRFNVETKSLTK
jgi:hypothetical protein